MSRPHSFWVFNDAHCQRVTKWFQKVAKMLETKLRIIAIFWVTFLSPCICLCLSCIALCECVFLCYFNLFLV